MLSPKKERILTTLDKLEMATRYQLNVLLKLGTERHSSRILKDIVDEGYLHKQFLEKKYVYYLSEKGRGYIGSSKVVKKDLQVKHRIMRNDVYLHYQPDNWTVEKEAVVRYTENKDGILIKQEKVIKGDAYFTNGNKHYFVEIDNEQRMYKNESKIYLYSRLFELMRKNVQQPILVVYTLSEVRRKKWEGWCKKEKIPFVILTPKDM